MEFFTAGLVILLALILFGLLLILGLVRRLRALTERVGRLEGNSPHLQALPGTTPGDFTAASTDGEQLTDAWLSGSESVVAFLTYGCSACKVQLPVLREHGARGQRILAVAALVPGEEPEPAQLRAALGDSPVIVEEEFGGPVQLAFGVDKYPTFYLVGADQKLQATAPGMRDLMRFRDSRLPAAAAR